MNLSESPYYGIEIGKRAERVAWIHQENGYVLAGHSLYTVCRPLLWVRVKRGYGRTDGRTDG